MPYIPRRHGHFVFATIQSGLTSLIAAGIASTPLLYEGEFFRHWFASWIISWCTIIPIVLLAAPSIRALVHLLTREDEWQATDK